jgi:hypothetical protein
MNKPERDEGEETTAKRGAPHDVTLFVHAEIAAELAEGDRPQRAVLEPRSLTEGQWNEATQYWMKRMGDDVRAHGQEARVPTAYSDAFSRAQDGLKPLPEMDIEGYATLVTAIQRAGSPARPLAARSLSVPDYLRLSRHFAKAMSQDPGLAKRYFDTLESFAPAAEETDGADADQDE